MPGELVLLVLVLLVTCDSWYKYGSPVASIHVVLVHYLDNFTNVAYFHMVPWEGL